MDTAIILIAIVLAVAVGAFVYINKNKNKNSNNSTINKPAYPAHVKPEEYAGYTKSSQITENFP